MFERGTWYEEVTILIVISYVIEFALGFAIGIAHASTNQVYLLQTDALQS